MQTPEVINNEAIRLSLVHLVEKYQKLSGLSVSVLFDSHETICTQVSRLKHGRITGLKTITFFELLGLLNKQQKCPFNDIGLLFGYYWNYYEQKKDELERKNVLNQ